jgi:hypothetical protein
MKPEPITNNPLRNNTNPLNERPAMFRRLIHRGRAAGAVSELGNE